MASVAEIKPYAMLTREEIANNMGHSFPVYPAFSTFYDLHTWAIIFGYGAENERSFEDLAVNALRALDQMCAITYIGNVFIIVVQFYQPRVKNYQMPVKLIDGSTLEATIRSKDTGDDISFTVVMHTQRFGLKSNPDFNFQCSVLNHTITEQECSRPHAMVPHKFRETRLELRHLIRFQPSVSRVDYETQLSTVSIMTSKTDPISHRFHPAMLLQNRLGMPDQKFSSLVGGDFTQDLVVKKGVKGKELFDK